MFRTKLIFLTAFALAMAAGVVVGRVWGRLPVDSAPVVATNGPTTSAISPTSVPANPPPPLPRWVAEQLDLSTPQRQQMDAIWADSWQQIRKTFDARHGLDRDRDQAVQNLLTTDQKAQYEKIIADFRSKRADLDKERGRLVKDAEDRSRALLSDTQKQKWDALKPSHDWRGGRGGPPGGGPGDMHGPHRGWATTRDGANDGDHNNDHSGDRP